MAKRKIEDEILLVLRSEGECTSSDIRWEIGKMRRATASALLKWLAPAESLRAVLIFNPRVSSYYVARERLVTSGKVLVRKAPFIGAAGATGNRYYYRAA